MAQWQHQSSGQPTDPNDPALQSTNARKAMQDAVAKKIAAEKGEQAAKQYRDAMGVAEAAYGIYLSAGGLSGVVDIGSSAATQYINLINSGVSPEAAGKLVGVQAVLDAVGETGAFDDAVGAAVKKSGLMDMLIEWGRKIPGAKEMIQNVKDRTAAALHRLGMDLYTWDLTRDQETEAIKLAEAMNDFTDEEAGQIAQQVASELTHSDVNATIESNKTIFLKSKNMKLEGMQHPETDVAFKKVQFILNGSSCEVVAAQFKNVGQVHLQQEAYLWRRGKQDRCSSLLLWETLSQMDQSQNALTEEQMQQLAKGKKPTGYTWHHDVIPGTVQLVDTKIHQKTGHTGGYAIWGRGSKTGGYDDG